MPSGSSDRFRVCRDRPPESQGRGSDHGQRTAGDQDRALGGGPPFGTAEVEAMSRQVSTSANRPYGVLRVTRLALVQPSLPSSSAFLSCGSLSRF